MSLDNPQAGPGAKAATPAGNTALLDPGQLLQVARCFASAVVEMGPTLLTPELLNPLRWPALGAQGAVDLFERGAAGLRLLPAGDVTTALVEVRSKVQVFCLVLDVSRLIGEPKQGPLPLPELVARSYALGPFEALWAIEGLGHDYAASILKTEPSPRGILYEEQTGPVPASSLLMLHAGIGLAFAELRLEPFRDHAPARELAAAVAEIVRLDRENSRPGYVGAALESLGLVTRTYHAPLVAEVDRILRQVAPEVLGYYWHGVGRALYFLPINILPCSDWQVFAMGQKEAPDEEAWANAWAGSAWAFALVLQRQPRALADLVVRPYGNRLTESPGFANGVASAAVMRFATTPQAPFVDQFLAFQPFAPGTHEAELWQQLVHGPYLAGVKVFFPVLARHQCLDQVFHYQDLPALVARLEREDRA